MASEATAVEVPAQSAAGFKRTKKDRILMQIKSLDEKDDERTSISKRISWILRQGAKMAGVEQDKNKWVKLSELCECEVLKEYGQELIWKVIVDFNGKKLRYEIEEASEGTRIRAYQRDETYKKEQRRLDMPIKVSGTSGDGLRKDAPEFAPWKAPEGGEEKKEEDKAATNVATPPSAAAMAQAQQAAYAAAAAQMSWGMGGMGLNPMMMAMMQQSMFQQAAAAHGKQVGRIKSYSAQKGFGFIECQATYAQYERDVFLHKQQIGDLTIGSVVVFSCEVNKQGMPQAKDVQAAGPGTMPSFGGKGGKDGGKDGKGKGKGGKKGKGEEGGKKGKGKGKDKKEGKQAKKDGEGGDEEDKKEGKEAKNDGEGGDEEAAGPAVEAKRSQEELVAERRLAQRKREGSL